jgi:hypothetical protein
MGLVQRTSSRGSVTGYPSHPRLLSPNALQPRTLARTHPSPVSAPAARPTAPVGSRLLVHRSPSAVACRRRVECLEGATTILGEHTVHELNDLVTALAYEGSRRTASARTAIAC